MQKLMLSVIVCTYNRANLLSGCLKSLAEQTVSTDFFEVIVVDNGSTDNTHEIAANYKNLFYNFRIIAELNQGLSHARNRGMTESLGEYVAYIDDDAEAFPDWINNILLYISKDKSIVAFGGPYYAFAELPLPDWFPPEYGCFDAGDTELQLNDLDIFLCGTNMIFKRDILREYGGFNTNLGMTGNTLSYGEETNLQVTLNRKGYGIYYVPSIKVRHCILEYKLNLGWLLYSVYSSGRCSGKTLSVNRNIFSHTCGLLIGVASAIKTMLIQWNIPFKRKVYYALNRFMSELGAFHEYFTFKCTRARCE